MDGFFSSAQDYSVIAVSPSIVCNRSWVARSSNTDSTKLCDACWGSLNTFKRGKIFWRGKKEEAKGAEPLQELHSRMCSVTKDRQHNLSDTKCAAMRSQQIFASYSECVLENAKSENFLENGGF